MAALARQEAPWEACGLLAGKTMEEVEHFYPLTNIDRAAEHFSMDPKEQFAAVKDMRKHNWRMIGIWHSHPATPPRMSEEDKRLAFTPNVLYVILSLADPDAPSIVAFRMDNQREIKIPCRVIERVR